MLGIVGHRQVQPVYNASKGAVLLLTKAMAIQYAKDGTRANSVQRQRWEGSSEELGSVRGKIPGAARTDRRPAFVILCAFVCAFPRPRNRGPHRIA